MPGNGLCALLDWRHVADSERLLLGRVEVATDGRRQARVWARRLTASRLLLRIKVQHLLWLRNHLVWHLLGLRNHLVRPGPRLLIHSVWEGMAESVRWSNCGTRRRRRPVRKHLCMPGRLVHGRALDNGRKRVNVFGSIVGA